MKYMMLISLGPEARDFQSLSQEEQQQIYAGWKAINETPGVTPGSQLQAPETATTVRVAGRPDADHRRPVRRDQGGARRLLHLRGRGPRRGDRGRVAGAGAALGGSIEIRPLAQW